MSLQQRSGIGRGAPSWFSHLRPFRRSRGILAPAHPWPQVSQKLYPVLSLLSYPGQNEFARAGWKRERYHISGRLQTLSGRIPSNGSRPLDSKRRVTRDKYGTLDEEPGNEESYKQRGTGREFGCARCCGVPSCSCWRRRIHILP